MFVTFESDPNLLRFLRSQTNNFSNCNNERGLIRKGHWLWAREEKDWNIERVNERGFSQDIWKRKVF